MPYKSEKLRVGIKYDRRRKLTPVQYTEIRHKYLEIGRYSQRQLAKEYNVSRRLIVYILYPERKVIPEYKGYNPKHKDYMKDHRKYKNKLYKNGKI